MAVSSKAALVTGGSRGIGAETVRRLAAEGHDVAFTYVANAEAAQKVAQDVEAAGRRALAIRADSASADDIIAAVKKTAEHFGRLDVLVNNAGIFPAGEVDDVTIEDVDRALSVNTRAVFLASQAAGRLMGKGGRIISVGSCLGEQVPQPGVTVYSMSKAALIGMTRGLARDYGPRGITVNLVQPGSTDTDMNPAEGPAAADQLARTPLGHFGTPGDVAALIAFLAGDGGRQITGALLNVDGGHNA